MRGATVTSSATFAQRIPEISTHAPLAGRDERPCHLLDGKIYSRRHFNPRAPCGARLSAAAGLKPEQSAIFQPTRPLRGATDDLARVQGLWTADISTHAPLAGRDDVWEDMQFQRDRSAFQPTRPLRGATRRYPTHEGAPPHFNPRAPCGARRWGEDSSSFIQRIRFQPTRPLAGRDHCGSHQPCCGTYFNPRAPCGARPLAIRLLLPRANISTHAPLAGRDGESLTTVADAIRISTHAPLAGRDCGGHRQKHDGAGISTHAPLAGRDRW